MLHNPSLLFPGLMFPLLNFAAFAGGLSRLRHVPGFDYAPGYAGFQFCFVLLQSAAFGGVFTGFGIARDFEYGFSRRLLLAASRRSGIIAGYAIGALVRWLITAGRRHGRRASLAGMRIKGDGIDLVGLFTLAVLIVNLAFLLWACGVAMRFQSVQAGPIMQTPVFLILFFAPVYVPLEPAPGLDPRGRDREPGHAAARGVPQPARRPVRPRSGSPSASPSGLPSASPPGRSGTFATPSRRPDLPAARLAHRARPDALLARRKDAVRVDRVLDRLHEAHVGVVVEAVLLRRRGP